MILKLAYALLATCLVAVITFFFIDKTATQQTQFEQYFVHYDKPIETYAGPKFINGISASELWVANKGRAVVNSEGKFHFPATVQRVWLDVGASMLETTRNELFTKDDLGLIAVEPLEICWSKWPRMERLIAIPFAMDSKEGEQKFYQSRESVWSSLAKSVISDIYKSDREIVEELTVKTYNLSRILELIPSELEVELLKVDVQGRDLQVLKSASLLLQRVTRIKTEVILQHLYEGDELQGSDPEKKFTDYLAPLGFVLEDRTMYTLVDPVSETRSKFYMDVTYVNKGKLITNN